MDCAPLLLDELTHRVSHELAAAMCIVSLAAARTTAEDARDALYWIRRRLENFSRVHQLLQRPRHITRVDAGAYLRQLCDALESSKLQAEGIELTFVQRKLPLESDQCWRLGMIVSELVTNAWCRAFDEGAGRIRVDASRFDTTVQCRVQDNGSGSPAHPGDMGLEIIDTLVHELGGQLDQRFGPGGSVSTLVFPIVPEPLRV
ncbi:MAG TPA: sensor histidine kinase [Steroidobacteraceae bacterium]|nr:sensor histidine kinase [Steroidobacteraceae bacterium]